MDDSIQGENPWQVPSLDEFLYYCCPECDLKTKEHILFFEHAVKIHEQAKDVLCLQEEKHEQEDFIVPAGCGKSFESNDGYKKHLKEHVQVWDVAAERQVEISGKDSAKLVQLMTCRDLSKSKVGRCYYCPIIDENGNLVNDPVILKL